MSSGIARSSLMARRLRKTCNLLKPGGYGRLHRYLENLGAKMMELGARSIPELIERYAGQPGMDAGAASLLNTTKVVEEATANPRYSWEHNKGVPRKIGSRLWL